MSIFFLLSHGTLWATIPTGLLLQSPSLSHSHVSTLSSQFPITHVPSLSSHSCLVSWITLSSSVPHSPQDNICSQFHHIFYAQTSSSNLISILCPIFLYLISLLFLSNWNRYFFPETIASITLQITEKGQMEDISTRISPIFLHIWVKEKIVSLPTSVLLGEKKKKTL